MALVCVHCGNPVEEIDRGDKKMLMHGELFNKFRHGRPRPYPLCEVNPLMDEDVEEDGEPEPE
jgi:hypothetical protein